MTDNGLCKVAKEHLASYLRLAASHEGRSEEDDQMAMLWRDKADAIADLLEDWKKRGGTEDAAD